MRSTRLVAARQSSCSAATWWQRNSTRFTVASRGTWAATARFTSHGVYNAARDLRVLHSCVWLKADCTGSHCDGLHLDSCFLFLRPFAQAAAANPRSMLLGVAVATALLRQGVFAQSVPLDHLSPLQHSSHRLALYGHDRRLTAAAAGAGRRALLDSPDEAQPDPDAVAPSEAQTDGIAVSQDDAEATDGQDAQDGDAAAEAGAWERAFCATQTCACKCLCECMQLCFRCLVEPRTHDRKTRRCWPGFAGTQMGPVASRATPQQQAVIALRPRRHKGARATRRAARTARRRRRPPPGGRTAAKKALRGLKMVRNHVIGSACLSLA